MLNLSIETAVEVLFILAPDPPLVESIQPNFANVEEGDHLFYKTPFGINVHFYVASNLGDGKIEVYGRFCKGNDDPFVEQNCFLDNTTSTSSLKLEKRTLDIADVENPDRLKRILHTGTNIPEEMQRLEKYKTQKTLYGFLNNNSEHFVTFIKTGTAQCEIVSEFKKALMKHFAAQVALPGGIDDLKAAMKDGNWAALVGVLENLGYTSDGSKESIVENISVKPAVTLSTIQVAVEAAKAAIRSKTVVCYVVIEGTIYTVSMSTALYQYINGHMSKEEFKDYTVKRSTTSVGSLTGGIVGLLVGVAAGAAIGLGVPVIGTTIGGAVGGIVVGIGGGLGGTALGRFIGNWINWLRS